MERFLIECAKCGEHLEVLESDITGLDLHIEETRAEARREGAEDARCEWPCDPDDAVDPRELTGGQRPLFDLALALKRGDLAAGDAALDRIASLLGVEAQELVASARVSRMAA